MSAHRTITRALCASGTTTLVLLAAAGAAQAHVTVKPETTETGAFSQLVLRTPNESDTASTVELSVTLPTKEPFLHVSVLPVPGWTFEVTETKLAAPVESFGGTVTEAPSRVTWTATGGGVKPGEYQNFAISVGPLPAPGELVLPATQTYSDGKIVRWDTAAEPGDKEPEHPAPSFTVTTGSAAHQAQEAAEKAVAATNVESGQSDPTALAVGGLLVGTVALVLALVAVVRGRQRQEA